MLTRRRLLATAAAGPPAAALASAGTEPAVATSMAAAVAASAAGKNILIFITDQQRKTMHFPAGWEQENLPGLTRLKENGLSFENAFCNSAMCSPSRATLFTGLYPAQHGVKYTLEEDMAPAQAPAGRALDRVRQPRLGDGRSGLRGRLQGQVAPVEAARRG